MNRPMLWGALWLLSTVAAAAPPGVGPGAGKPPAAACAAPKGPPPGPSYLLATEADIVTLLPPPPAPDSQAQRDDLQAVLDAQREARERGTNAHAVADVDANCARFADAVGEALTSKDDAATLAFLNQAAREGSRISGAAKKYWKRTRPYAYSSEVQRLGDMAPDWKAPPDIDTGSRAASEPGSGPRPEAPPMAPGAVPPGMTAASDCAPPTASARPARDKHSKKDKKSEALAKQQAVKDKEKAAQELAESSYPSGHATFGTVCAILLADMVPERRREIFERNRDYEHSRMVVGAHYPSDLESGRIAGTVATTLMMQNAQFQRDFAAAQTHLRAVLHLPAELPDLTPKSQFAPALPGAAQTPAPGATVSGNR